MRASTDRRLCRGGFCSLISPHLDPASAPLPTFECWMADRNSKMCQRGSDGDQSAPCDSTPKRGNAIPVGQGEFGGSKKKKAGNPEGRIFVETVEMTSITRDLEHITCFASGR